MESTNLTYDDVGAYVDTLHDADSAKDFNPLYFLANRRVNPEWHDRGKIFNKYGN